MKIAEIISFREVNGVVTHVRLLVDELVKRDHEVILIHRPDAWIAKQVDPARVRLMPASLRRTARELRRVGNALRDQGVDLIHTHGSSAHSYGMIFRLAGKVPIVATAQSRKIQIHWPFNNRVIAPSEDTAAFHRRVNLVPRRKIDVIPNFVDASAFEQVNAPRRAEMRGRLGLPRAAFVIGSVGAICRRKRQSDMVRTLPYLLAAGFDAHLVLVGVHANGPEDRAVQAQIDALGLADRVHLLGHREDVCSILQVFDVYLCSSRKEEAPMAVLEAMAVGLPIVSTNTGGIKEMVVEGMNGHRVAFGDVETMAARLVELGTDAKRRVAYGEASRERVAANFVPGAVVPRIEEVYRKAAGQSTDWDV
jgi:glycosyltransferase involved in cell wall biosynthesis